jgi:hypothetical protein
MRTPALSRTVKEGGAAAGSEQAAAKAIGHRIPERTDVETMILPR